MTDRKVHKISGKSAHASQHSRRKFLAASAATVATSALGGTLGLTETARAKTFALGDFSISVLSDGHLVVPSAFLARNASAREREGAMRGAGQVGERINAPTNITLVRTKSEVILIDTGAGPHFMPSAGNYWRTWKLPGLTDGVLRKSCTPTVTLIICGVHSTISTRSLTFQMPVTS